MVSLEVNDLKPYFHGDGANSTSYMWHILSDNPRWPSFQCYTCKYVHRANEIKKNLLLASRISWLVGAWRGQYRSLVKATIWRHVFMLSCPKQLSVYSLYMGLAFRRRFMEHKRSQWLHNFSSIYFRNKNLELTIWHWQSGNEISYQE